MKKLNTKFDKFKEECNISKKKQNTVQSSMWADDKENCQHHAELAPLESSTAFHSL